MLKEFIEKIVSLKENKIYNVDHKVFSDNELKLIHEKKANLDTIKIYSLESIVGMIKEEIKKFATVQLPLFIHIEDYDKITVFSSLDNDRERENYICCQLPNSTYRFDIWRDYENFMIALRSQFIQNIDSEYLIHLLASISNENKITNSDTGISQTVEVRKGISLKGVETVKSIVKLIPYRTFLEVEQPESEFLVRVSDEGIRLFEADGGRWKVQAKENIQTYLQNELRDLTSQNKVICMI